MLKRSEEEIQLIKQKLTQRQALPLEAKIRLTKQRIQEWYDYYDGRVYVSFSGGKDSTVLAHLAKQVYSDIPLVFCNTGLEYPEVREFAEELADEVVKPKMNFKQVLTRYGYPIISKEQSGWLYYANKGAEWAIRKVNKINKDGSPSMYGVSKKFRHLLHSDIPISSYCCTVMKKSPLKSYERTTHRKPIIGVMTEESNIRTQAYIRKGSCNAFDIDNPQSTPMSFWTEQDVLQYLKEYDIPFASVYGDIIIENGIYKTTGCHRTGCIFCGYGCHLEKEPNRFQMLSKTHPDLYNYCIGGGTHNEEGMWQPTKEGLGLGYVLDKIGVKYD